MIRPETFCPSWPNKPLVEVVEFLDHLRCPITARDRKSGPYPYYGANGQQDSVADYIFDEALILLAEDGGYFGDPDRTIAYRVEGKCWVNNHAHVLRPKAGVDIGFLCRQLEKYDVNRFINGATRQKLTKSSASKIPITLPPLPEQKRIAAILDKADAIRRKRQQAINLADDFLRATFLDMFGDPVTNPKGLPLERLENMVNNLIRGPFGGSLKKEIFVPTGYKVYEQKHSISGDFTIGSYCIDEDKYEEMSRFSLSPGDLIVSCSGTVGRVAIVPSTAKPGIINQALLKIVPDESKASSVYLKAILESNSVQKVLYNFSHGSGLHNFPPMGEIRALPIPVPTTKQLEKVSYSKVKVTFRN